MSSAKRRDYRIQWGFVMLVVSACAGSSETASVASAAPGQPASEPAAQSAFLAPLAGVAAAPGRVYPAAAPEVRLCDWTGAACAPVLAIWTTTSGPAGQTVGVDPETGTYRVDWHPDHFRLQPDHVYRIRVLLGGAEVSYLDVGLNGSGRLIDLDTGSRLVGGDQRVVPIRFRLTDAGPAIAMQEPGGDL